MLELASNFSGSYDPVSIIRASLPSIWKGRRKCHHPNCKGPESLKAFVILNYRYNTYVLSKWQWLNLKCRLRPAHGSVLNISYFHFHGPKSDPKFLFKPQFCLFVCLLPAPHPFSLVPLTIFFVIDHRKVQLLLCPSCRAGVDKGQIVNTSDFLGHYNLCHRYSTLVLWL